MRSLRKAVPVTLAGLLLVAILWAAFHNQEPAYGGHPLSYWTDVATTNAEGMAAIVHLGTNAVPITLQWFERGPTRESGGHRLRYWTGVAATNAEAMAAIRHIGTNALPITLKWLQYERSPTREKAYDRMHTLPAFIRPRWLMHSLSSDHGIDRAQKAVFVLVALGPQARSLAPDLLRFATNTSSPGASYRAFDALGALGTNGLPGLLDILQNARTPYRRGAAIAIGDVMETERSATSAVPALVQCVSEPNPDPIFVIRVSEALATCNPEPRLVVPTFRKLLTSTNSLIRNAATNLMNFIAPEAITNAPAQ